MSSDDNEDNAADRRGSSSVERQRRRGQPEATPTSASASVSGGPGAKPDDVLRLLESCQLTDEEADDLLKDAYALNRLLRAHLAHVESSNGARGHNRSGSGDGGASAGSRQSSGFSRQLGGGAGHHQQSSSRRSVSLSGRTNVATSATSASLQQQQQRRLPPISRAKSPGQRLSEMARAYSSGVIQAGHRGSAAPDASKSAKKRL